MSCIALIPEDTQKRITDHLGSLQTHEARAGARLIKSIAGEPFAGMSPQVLLARLIDTKVPQIFAESAVAGDGSDWTLPELRLMGDISIAVDVTIYDNGAHTSALAHSRPFEGTLVYTPGALLRHGSGGEPADLEEVTDAQGLLCTEGYYKLYERRLLPVFQHIQDHAHKQDAPALVTIPGLGCGQFAGGFRGQLGKALESTLKRFLETHGRKFPMITAIYYDPYNECSNERHEIHGISYMVRPLAKGNQARGNQAKTQLCLPASYAEAGEDFSGCRLYSLVAWDHVSWPGNDFFAGSRCTDDGVKAAATDSMHAITGIRGSYDPKRAAYLPPKPHQNWAGAVRTHRIQLSTCCGLQEA